MFSLSSLICLAAFSAEASLDPKGSADGSENRRISFVLDVQPILTKAGCNQGSCHGAALGKGGFRLSLRGFDDQADYQEAVWGGEGRRTLPGRPEQSLLFTKPTLRQAHQGGRRIEAESWAGRTLAQWIEQGAEGPRNEDVLPVALDIQPNHVIAQPGQKLELRVLARFPDGREELVNQKSSFDCANTSVVEISAEGKVTAKGAGDAVIMVRCYGRVGVSRIIVPYGVSKRLEQFAIRNDIDRLMVDHWKDLGLTPSGRSSDVEFYRRIHLDAVGTLPTPEQVKTFLADRRQGKRERAIEEVLARPEYVDYWAYKWGDLLRNNRNTLLEKGMWALHLWLREQLRVNRPMDEFVRDLITASGSPYQNGPANYYRVGRTPADWAENTAQVFLGTRLQCAKCHHHPFESYSQRDYYQLTAFFARVSAKNSDEFGLFGRDTVIHEKETGETRHPRTNQVMAPVPLGGAWAGSTGKMEGERRAALADWLCDPRQMGLARNIVNRYWGYLMGRGLVHPIDDLRVSNPASAPAVFDWLARDFIEHGYDVKHLLRRIMTSSVYQLDATAAEESLVDGDNRYFTHYGAKRLTAEQLLDAIDFACGTREKYQQMPLGTRAIALPDTSVGSRFLDAFGRPRREISCECERADTPNMTQALQLLTGTLLNSKVFDKKGLIARMVKENRSPDAIIEEIYYRTVSRPPTPQEAQQAMDLVATASSSKEGLEDLLWTLLNTREFQFNH